MMGSTHKVGGLLVGTAAARLVANQDVCLSGIRIVGLLFGSILGSMLNDIDKKESSIGRILWFISWPIYLFRIIIKAFAVIFLIVNKLVIKISGGKYRKVGLKLRVAFIKVYKTTGHRGLAHSLVTWATLSGCCWIFVMEAVPKLPMIIGMVLPSFLLGVSIGMLSHIILDLFNGEGEALLAPFTDHKFSIADIDTGGLMVGALRYAMLIGAALIGYRSVITYIGSIKI